MQQTAHSAVQNTNIMMQPPAAITVKDSLYLTDMLSWNLLAMKKAHFFAANTKDQTIKSHLEKCGQMHQKHYEQIISHLNAQQPFNSGTHQQQ
ncbi:hypothetical protein [Niallia sp. NCCP-28]|uniref:hypothetical protein n=1 Tax=Niallia sp. NCCP-28 TaxID=2934712 RepID=UPI00207ED959|nr:hypothetical protein [Niallia sp. NCCP-28]GKU83224.1 hypothetical protein NCCP28_26200 [Niallia sp. NCCP-28]